MFVILKWNQAGGRPRVAIDVVYEDRNDAIGDAADMQKRAAPRRDRYTVHPLDDELDEEG